MEPVSETPTAPVDYAALSATYAALLGATAAGTRRRAPLERGELVPLAAATFALSKLVVHEKVESWVRHPFLDERSDGRRPRGRRLRYAVGELLSCTRCTGAWAALGLTALRLNAPAAGRTVTYVLAASAGSDFLQAAFSWICARATSQSHDAEWTASERRAARATSQRAA